ncbi:MAG: hypothetical protein HY078_08760 [Elusimicrobia bacterium]|nr:hypothetical protein [Elusimicrobiota bacterium]
MVATAIISIGIVSMFGSFRLITMSLYTSRTRILATNLAQEKIETLKNNSYYQLLITTTSAVDNSISPGILYDSQNYPPEVISIGGITYTREVFVSLASMYGNVISTVAFTYPDTGLKQITVYVLWTDGGVRRKYSLSNLLENPNVSPLDSGFTGTVKQQVTGTPNLATAVVKTLENPGFKTYSATDGSFSFRVAHGSYTLHVSSWGFQDAYLPIQSAYAGTTSSAGNIYLTPISSGSISGIVWISTQLVISQVVASTLQVNGFDAQYVELYNPTTAPINIATSGGSPIYELSYQSNFGPLDCFNINMVYTSTYVPSYGYYLYANTTTFTINGNTITADAHYANPQTNCSPTGWSYPTAMPILAYGHSGSVLLEYNGRAIDSVGWNAGSGAQYCEGTCIQVTAGGGFARGDQFVRISSPAVAISAIATSMANNGHAYDSDNNQVDFYYPPNATSSVVAKYGINYNPRSSGDAIRPPITSRVGAGAVVGTNDSYSGSTVAYTAYITSGAYSLPYAPFRLAGVSTGAWTIDIASDTYYLQPATVTVNQNVDSPIFGIMLSSFTLGGYIKGTVRNVNGQVIIPAISMIAGGVPTTASSTNGLYFAAVSSGTISVIANVNNANPNYVQAFAYPTVQTGRITDLDFNLTLGGVVYAYLTSGTSPLPNISVVAVTAGGSEAGSGTSDSSGYAYIQNISSGTYTVYPTLDTGQSSDPYQITGVTVVDGQTVFAGSFTVAGAYGNITGTVTYNGATLTTGGLVLASTTTLTTSPSTVCVSPVGTCTTAAAALGAVVYAASTKADGTYDVQVRGGSNYNIMIYIPTVTGSSTVSVVTKGYSGINVTAATNTNKAITYP